MISWTIIAEIIQNLPDIVQFVQIPSDFMLKNTKISKKAHLLKAN